MLVGVITVLPAGACFAMKLFGFSTALTAETATGNVTEALWRVACNWGTSKLNWILKLGMATISCIFRRQWESVKNLDRGWWRNEKKNQHDGLIHLSIKRPLNHKSHKGFPLILKMSTSESTVMHLDNKLLYIQMCLHCFFHLQNVQISEELPSVKLKRHSSFKADLSAVWMSYFCSHLCFFQLCFHLNSLLSLFHEQYNQYKLQTMTLFLNMELKCRRETVLWARAEDYNVATRLCENTTWLIPCVQ